MTSAARALSGAEVLARRRRVQQLDTPADRVDEVAVLDIGVQDTPRGSAQLALLARCAAAPHTIRDAMAGPLRLVLGARGAPHAIRGRGAARVRAGLTPIENSQAEHVTAIASSMHDLLGSTRTITKPELSARLNDRVDDAVRIDCARCRSRHVDDELFRLASLQAGLALDPGASAPTRFVSARSDLGSVTDRSDIAEARSRLARRFVHPVGRPDRPNWRLGSGSAPERWPRCGRRWTTNSSAATSTASEAGGWSATGTRGREQTSRARSGSCRRQTRSYSATAPSSCLTVPAVPPSGERSVRQGSCCAGPRSAGRGGNGSKVRRCRSP